jgi:hypothetical protein
MSLCQLYGGAFGDFGGNTLANGSLSLRPTGDALGQDAQLVGGPNINISLDGNGNIPNINITASPTTSPAGIAYLVSAYSNAGVLAWQRPQIWYIPNVPNLDVGTLMPVSSGVSYPSPIIATPVADQTIQAYNLNPNSASGQQYLGTLASPWSAVLNTANVTVANVGTLSTTLATINTADINSLAMTGQATEYMGVSLALKGLPSIVAATIQSNLNTAVGNTTLATVATNGTYRFNSYVKLTNVAQNKSNIGPINVSWTDPSGQVLTTQVLASLFGGTTGVIDTNNSIVGVLAGFPVTLACLASTNVTYNVGYASNSTGIMNYSLRLSLEAL